MPRVTRMIPIGQIVVDRLPLNRRTLELAHYLDMGGKVPAIRVQATSKDGGLLAGNRYRILNGRHRVLACRLLGRTMIEAKFWIPEPRARAGVKLPDLWPFT